MLSAFANLKHNTYHRQQRLCFRNHLVTTVFPNIVTSPQATCMYSRRDPCLEDYIIWPFDNKGYAVVRTVTNCMANIDLSLWAPLLTEESSRQACVEYCGRYCNYGSSELTLRLCPILKNILFSPLMTLTARARHGKKICSNTAVAILTADAKTMVNTLRLGSSRSHKHHSVQQSNSTRTRHTLNIAARPIKYLTPTSALGPFLSPPLQCVVARHYQVTIY